MTGLEALIDQPVIQAVGWALLHFVWQGTLVGALAAVALRVLRRSAADVRYVVAAVAFSLMATLPLVTGVQVFRAARAELVHSPPAAEPGFVTTGATSLMNGSTATESFAPIQESAAAPRIAAVERWLPLFVLAWMAGVGILAVRLMGGWLWLQRMKSHGAVPADDALQALVRRLSRSLHIGRTIRLLRSPGVDVPTVIGWLKPTVLLPMSALSGMSPLQIEAILAHELAHVRRHDYLVNLLQTLLETLLFYHPAVWWLSRQIRTERENCCDDLAVSLCGDPIVYARALADLEQLRGSSVRLVLAASGGALLDRVRRLLTGPATHAGRGPAWLAATAAVLLMLVIAGGAVGRQSLSASPATPPASVPPPEPEVVAVSPDAAPDALPDVAKDAVERQRTPESADQGSPTPPSPPASPAPPAPPDRSVTAVGGHEQRSSGTFTWSSDGEKIEVNYNGAFEINDDDTGIAKLSPGGRVRISDGTWFRGRSIEFTADSSGTITTRYWVGSTERAFEPEGRQWLATIMPKLVRRSGFAAKARVARYLQKGGVSAVLAEISQIESGYAKKVYFTELLKRASLDAEAARRLLEQAGREVESDYELATILIAAADTLLVDDATRKAYFAAARTLDSDYEMRRALTAALKRSAMTPALMTELLGAARALDSDYEAASLLLDVVRQQGVEGPLRAPFFAVVGELSSTYERGRVLKALLRRSDVSPATLLDILTSAGAMGSDYEASQVLQTAARSQAITGPARAAYLEAADRLGDYEQTQALAALVRNERK